MTTTIFKTIEGFKMAAMFEANHPDMSIRYFYTDVEETEFKDANSYRYRIVIRHNENTDAEKLFDDNLLKLYPKKKIHTSSKI
jgi:hypothetical protein